MLTEIMSIEIIPDYTGSTVLFMRGISGTRISIVNNI